MPTGRSPRVPTAAAGRRLGAPTSSRANPPGGRRPTATESGARRARWCTLSAVLADLRAQVLAAETGAANLEVALVTNRRIGIAIGIVMCRLQVTEDGAFAVLRTQSQNRNVKLRDLAEEVIYTGSL